MSRFRESFAKKGGHLPLATFLFAENYICEFECQNCFESRVEPYPTRLCPKCESAIWRIVRIIRPRWESER